MTQLVLFDYQQLDTETRIVVQQRTSEIKALMKRTAQGIIEIGVKLIEIKERLGHGRFGAWLETEFGWDDRTARRFMAVAGNFKMDNLSNLNFAPSALYLLAAPSTPDEARQEAIERAEAGEPITYTAARGIVTEHKLNGNGRASFQFTSPSTQTESTQVIPEDNRPLYADDPGLDEALDEAPAGEEVDEKPYNYKRDNRRSTAADIYTPQGMDACQTPAYAIDPLLPYLDSEWIIWEPAAGEGLLVEALYDDGYRQDRIACGDLLTGQNFFDYEPAAWNCLITNPPYSIQFQWLERCYQLGRPFALLLKVEILGTKTAQELMQRYGFEILLLDKRVAFKMPRLGWGDDDHKSSAQFPTFWLCWQLLPEPVVFGKLNKKNGGGNE